jgi:hypothetical protein
MGASGRCGVTKVALGSGAVNAVVRDYLEQYAGSRRAQEKALAGLIELSQAAQSRRSRRAWTRDEFHER